MNQVIENPQFEIENKLGNVSLHRAMLYQWMSKAMLFPTFELAESLLNGDFYRDVEKSIQWVNTSGGMYNASLEKLKMVASNKDCLSPDELLKKMEEEYIRLFLVSEQMVVSPLERDYSDKANEFIIASIKKVYDEVGEIVFSNHHESPDHIAAQLDFLSYLGRQEGTSWINGEMLKAKKWKIKERTFIVHHLRKWGILFFVNMEKSTELEAYQALASVGKVFMTLEHGN